MIVFTNVSQFWTRDEVRGTVVDMFATQGALDFGSTGVVVAVHGQVVCSGAATSCASYLSSSEATVVDLAGGAVQPGLVNYGAELGLSEIFTEASTRDGYVADPLQGQPSFFGTGGYVAKAIDGLQFGTRDALCVHSTSPMMFAVLTSCAGWHIAPV